ncbi:MAG TPA: VWA domain-containing protein, partial [Thermoanaerobaculia bacterium]|nr:VWA domain-containing protein [Thermoanaerobaculia bacterium]
MQRFAAVVALLLAVPAFAQETTTNRFGEKVDVNVVLIDAIVTDHQGSQILGLTKDDFLVKEGPSEQALDALDYFTNRKLLNAREQDAPFKVEQVHEDRYFVFFFDKPLNGANTLWDEIANARDAVRHYVDEEMLPTDKVAIAGHDVRLKIYTDFTGDKAKIKRALDDVAKFGPGLKTATNDVTGPSILRNLDTDKMINHTGTVYQGLEVLANALRGIRARKNLALFSPGIVEHGEEVRGGVVLNRSRYYEPMIHALNAANVTAYSINLQRNAPPDPVFHQRLEEIASETSGEYFRFGSSFRPAVNRVEDINNGYYLLAYRTNKPAGTKGFQRVEVSVRNHPEFKVTARQG